MKNSYRLHSQHPGNSAPAPAAVEVIDDRGGSPPATHVEPLSPQVLQHWGLIGSPFAPPQSLDQPLRATEFYFRSLAHASAWSWLEHLVSGPASPAVLSTSSGAGATTWLRQLIATSGLGNTALETAAAVWHNQSLDQLTASLQNRAGEIGQPGHVRTLWLIQVTGDTASPRIQHPNRLRKLRQWWSARASQLTNLNLVLVAPKSDVRAANSLHLAGTSLPGLAAFGSHHLARSHSHELRRCVNAALHHAGAIRPAFTVSAVTYLAEASGGSIARLGALVHTALVHGQTAGIRQIRQSDLIACLGTRHHESEQLKARAA